MRYSENSKDENKTDQVNNIEKKDKIDDEVENKTSEAEVKSVISK